MKCRDSPKFYLHPFLILHSLCAGAVFITLEVPIIFPNINQESVSGHPPNPRSLCQPEAGEWPPFLHLLEGAQTEKNTGLALGGIRLFLLYIAFFKWMFFNISIFHMDPQLVEAKQTLTDCTITKLRIHS